jgi:hypothetical protein
MPVGIKQITRPLFDWLSTRQGKGAIAGVFFGSCCSSPCSSCRAGSSTGCAACAPDHRRDARTPAGCGERNRSRGLKPIDPLEDPAASNVGPLDDVIADNA